VSASAAEEALADALALNPLPEWDLCREYAFDASRRWKFDFAFPSQKLAVEVEGQYHRTYKGHLSDCEKFTAAAMAGWRVLRFTASQKRKAAEWAALIVECLVCVTPPPVR
jgi:very-short-patch-repair endonuclease